MAAIREIGLLGFSDEEIRALSILIKTAFANLVVVVNPPIIRKLSSPFSNDQLQVLLINSNEYQDITLPTPDLSTCYINPDLLGTNNDLQIGQFLFALFHQILKNPTHDIDRTQQAAHLTVNRNYERLQAVAATITKPINDINPNEDAKAITKITNQLLSLFSSLSATNISGFYLQVIQRGLNETVALPGSCHYSIPVSGETLIQRTQSLEKKTSIQMMKRDAAINLLARECLTILQEGKTLSFKVSHP